MKFLWLGMIIAFMSVSCKGGEENKAISPKSVKVENVRDLSQVERIYTGVVKADQSSSIAFKMGGLVAKTYVSSGSSVKKGDILMEIDPNDVLADFNAKKVNLAAQYEALKRAERLIAKSAISQQEFETTVATYESAKSSFNIAQDNMNQTKLYAPFSGFVLSKSINQYDRVQPGQKVIELVNPNDLEINFTVPESNAIYFTKDTELYVEFDAYKDKFFKCQLKQLIAASPDGAGIPFKLRIIDPEFSLDKYSVAVGFSCNVKACVRNNLLEGVYAVPVSSVVPDRVNENRYVMVYNDKTGVVEQKAVQFTSIIVEDGQIAVKGDISANDKIVVAGASRLVDGEAVKVLSK